MKVKKIKKKIGKDFRKLKSVKNHSNNQKAKNSMQVLHNKYLKLKKRLQKMMRTGRDLNQRKYSRLNKVLITRMQNKIKSNYKILSLKVIVMEIGQALFNSLFKLNNKVQKQNQKLNNKQIRMMNKLKVMETGQVLHHNLK